MKNIIILFLISIVVLLIAAPCFAEEISEDFLIPGRIEGNGIYFEIKNSEYLNIILKSTEEIKIFLESTPKMISLNIEVVNNIIDYTELKIEGLEPNKTYYKYEDSYKNEAVFISDETGGYSWEQDLSQPYHIWLQEEKAQYFCPTNAQLMVFGTKQQKLAF